MVLPQGVLSEGSTYTSLACPVRLYRAFVEAKRGSVPPLDG